MHHPVLLQTVMEQLSVHKDGIYIDATAGEGGHLLAIAAVGKKVLGIDRDKNQINKLKAKRADFKNVTFAVANFSEIESVAKENGFDKVDGIIFDLGLSWNQLDKLGIGLSYRNPDDPLDMRLDVRCQRSAEEIIGKSSTEELADLFMRNAEEVHFNEIARSIVQVRKQIGIKTVGGLLYAIDQVITEHRESVYKRIFQALRIEVNNEFENLTKGLIGATHLIKKNGRVAVITFHSLEDRKVKQFVKNNHLLSITKKAIPGNKKLRYERSALLRVFSL